MKYDLEQILSCVKNDDDWVRKFVIGSLFIIAQIILLIIPLLAIPLFPKAVLPLFIISSLLVVIIGCAVYGYGLQTAHDYINNPRTKLPQWSEFFSHAFVGFKALLGSILFYLPLLFLTACAFVFAHYLEGHSQISETYKVLTFCFNVLCEIVYLLYLLFYPLFNANFIKEFNLFEFLNVSKAYNLFKSSPMNYFILILLILAFGLLFNTAVILLAITVIGSILIPFVIMYINIICSVLTARFVQITGEQNYQQ